MRQPSQTPREYTTAIAAGNPGIQAELQEMTLAFEEARCSAHNPERGRARRVQQAWDLIRSQLRKNTS